MSIHFGFSYIGLIFLVMLMVPNMIWTQNQPLNYDNYVKNENKILALLERIGEVSVTVIALFFGNIDHFSISIWLIVAFGLMIIYEMYWLRYFRSEKTMQDFYYDYLGIPVAGATLPVVAFFLLGIYGQSILLIISTIILGIGHIGIHLQHQKETK